MYRSPRTGLLGLAFLVPLLSCGAQQPAAITVEKDVVYAKAGGQELKLNIAMPKEGDGLFPLILCVHGGGWRGGKREDLNALAARYAGNGFVAATITYRLAPEHRFPAQIEDTKAALRWLRANAKKYKIDPDRVGAIGFSAGGHLVSLLGTADKTANLEGDGGNLDQSSRVRAVVNYFGPTDFITGHWSDQVETVFLVPWLGAPFQEAKETYATASPVKYVSKDDPPFLFFHGTKDPLVPLHHSTALAEKLRAVGVPAEVVVMEGDGHGWGGEKAEKTFQQSLQFFREKLK